MNWKQIAGVKERLRKHTGTPVDMMKLVLRTSEGTPICELADDKRMLGFYSVTHGQNLHIVDLVRSVHPYAVHKFCVAFPIGLCFSQFFVALVEFGDVIALLLFCHRTLIHWPRAGGWRTPRW